LAWLAGARSFVVTTTNGALAKYDATSSTTAAAHLAARFTTVRGLVRARTAIAPWS
jgi:hypothetical protein